MAVGVTFPRGFRAAGATGGIKASGAPDTAVVVADGPASAAGVFTRSRTAGAPVVLCRERLAASGGRARAIVVASGNANVATGPQGARDAARMAALVAELADVADSEVLVMSTGVIGVPLPMARVEAGIHAACAALTADGGADAAEAMRTTDAHAKHAERTVELAGGSVRVGAIAKGAAMIRPDLGTMLAIVTTDAAIAPDGLQDALRVACDASFNRISVDGCESTSDSVVALAGGASGVAVGAADRAAFDAALADLCLELALAIVRDGEGARRIGVYEVAGAATPDDAERAARAVAESQLVRCALHGADPNWGRLVAALGACGADVDVERLAIDLGGVPLVRDGCAMPGIDGEAARAATADEVRVRIDLGLGGGHAVVYGSDLSTDYVRANAEYTT
jgi:glutamate N-acetyltransferase / amino-acid N-acetyltransferase